MSAFHPKLTSAPNVRNRPIADFASIYLSAAWIAWTILNPLHGFVKELHFRMGCYQNHVLGELVRELFELRLQALQSSHDSGYGQFGLFDRKSVSDIGGEPGVLQPENEPVDMRLPRRFFGRKPRRNDHRRLEGESRPSGSYPNRDPGRV